MWCHFNNMLIMAFIINMDVMKFKLNYHMF